MKNTNEDIEDVFLKHKAMSMMFLLFEEECEMPSDKEIIDLLNQKGYQINSEWEADDKSIRIFYLPEYTVDFDDAKNVPYQLSMFHITQVKKNMVMKLPELNFGKPPMVVNS